MSLPFLHIHLVSHKNGTPGIAETTEMVVILLLVTLLCGCTTTAHNIESTRELNGNKLLTGRFLFFINDIPLEDGIGFTIFFQEREKKRLREFNPDKNGYVYVSVEEGHYYLKRVSYRDLHGNFRFPVHQVTGIAVNTSDAAVNFGTVTVTLHQNITSRIAYVTTYAYPYAGTYIPSAMKPTLHLVQIPDYDATHQFILEDLGIAPESIREVALDFPEETQSH